MQILSITYTEEEKVHAAVIRKRNRKFDRVPIEEIGFLCRSSYVYNCTQFFLPGDAEMRASQTHENSGHREQMTAGYACRSRKEEVATLLRRRSRASTKPQCVSKKTATITSKFSTQDPWEFFSEICTNLPAPCTDSHEISSQFLCEISTEIHANFGIGLRVGGSPSNVWTPTSLETLEISVPIESVG